MLRHDESPQERQQKWDREFIKFRKQLRRERWSMFTLVGAWAVYIVVLPFTTSPEQIILLLSIFALFYLQFLLVMLWS